MNDQNETTQLRYLEETATRLQQNGFTVEPIEEITTCPSAGKKGASAAFPARAACCTGRSVSMPSARRTLCRR